MSTRNSHLGGALAGTAAVVGVLLVLMGVVMGDTHVPVAIEPDAKHPAGVEVATFALG